MLCVNIITFISTFHITVHIHIWNISTLLKERKSFWVAVNLFYKSLLWSLCWTCPEFLFFFFLFKALQTFAVLSNFKYYVIDSKLCVRNHYWFCYQSRGECGIGPRIKVIVYIYLYIYVCICICIILQFLETSLLIISLRVWLNYSEINFSFSLLLPLVQESVFESTSNTYVLF